MTSQLPSSKPLLNPHQSGFTLHCIPMSFYNELHVVCAISLAPIGVLSLLPSHFSSLRYHWSQHFTIKNVNLVRVCSPLDSVMYLPIKKPDACSRLFSFACGVPQLLKAPFLDLFYSSSVYTNPLNSLIRVSSFDPNFFFDSCGYQIPPGWHQISSTWVPLAFVINWQ